MLKIEFVHKNADGSLIRQSVDANGQPDATKPKYITLGVSEVGGLLNDTSKPDTVNILQSRLTDNTFTWGRVNPNDWANKEGQTIAGCVRELSAERHEIMPRFFTPTTGQNAGKEQLIVRKRVVILGVNEPTEEQVLKAQRLAGAPRPNKVACELALENAYAKLRGVAPKPTPAPAVEATADEMKA